MTEKERQDKLKIQEAIDLVAEAMAVRMFAKYDEGLRGWDDEGNAHEICDDLRLSKKKKKTCNQCGEQLAKVIGQDDIYLHCCNNPKCPNYALVQIPAEDITREGKNGKED
jgi:hypothetical protein